jgi:hypothetical protein
MLKMLIAQANERDYYIVHRMVVISVVNALVSVNIQNAAKSDPSYRTLLIFFLLSAGSTQSY